MSDIKTALQRIAERYESNHELEVDEDVFHALIDCARALSWRLNRSSFTADSGHHELCDFERNESRECTCGADALKRLSEL